jgi:hypothetical protein
MLAHKPEDVGSIFINTFQSLTTIFFTKPQVIAEMKLEQDVFYERHPF